MKKDITIGGIRIARKMLRSVPMGTKPSAKHCANYQRDVPLAWHTIDEYHIHRTSPFFWHEVLDQFLARMKYDRSHRLH